MRLYPTEAKAEEINNSIYDILFPINANVVYDHNFTKKNTNDVLKIKTYHNTNRTYHDILS